MKTLAIIPAAGAGKRMGGSAPKQYQLLAGVPVVVHTLREFQRSKYIDEVFLVVPENDVSAVQRDIVLRFGISAVSLVIAGGRQRQDSVAMGLARARGEHGVIVIHDGVRPFVTGDLIQRSVEGAKLYGAVTAGVPVKDTVKAVKDNGQVIKTVSREGLWLTQTPQAFRKDIILSAYRLAETDGFTGTDDASLVERMGVPVRMIRGHEDNIKVTMPDDMARGETIFRLISGSI